MREINLGKKLSKLRAEKGVTQDELASAMGVSNKTVSKWENEDSSPDLETLVALAEYYGVSTDSLLGLVNETNDTATLIKEEFLGLDKRESALKLFDIMRESFPSIFPATTNGISDDEYPDSVIPEKKAVGTRYSITMREMFDFLVCSDDVNFGVLEMRNKSNFGWLLDEEKQKKTGMLLSFLADADVMKVLYFIHSSDCSDSFTAEYISKNAHVELDKAVTILRQFCNLDICSVVTAHLKTGTVEVYNSFGDGIMLVLLSIAYERMCGSPSYNYYNGGRCKMIKGERK